MPKQTIEARKEQEKNELKGRCALLNKHSMNIILHGTIQAWHFNMHCRYMPFLEETRAET